MGIARTKAESIRDLITGVVAREGYELLDVELTADRGQQILRLYIDTVPPSQKGSVGVSVDDCAKVSRVVGDLLDVEESVGDNYTLEVSSPGLFRPLTQPEHFDRVLGQRVKVKTFERLEGRKVFTGILTGREGSTVTVDVDGQPFQLELKNVAKANLEPLL